MKRNENIRFIVTDLDGTLLNKESLLSRANRKAILELKEAGFYFTFASGRMDRMTWQFANDLELDLPIISCNGAMLRKRQEQNYIYRRTIPRDTVIAIKDLCEEAEADYLFYGLDTVYHCENSNRIQSFIRYNSIAKQRQETEVLIEALRKFSDGLPNEEITKSFIVFNKQYKNADTLKAKLKQLRGIEVVESAHGSVDVMPENCSKGFAVKYIANQLNLSMDQVCCIGDQSNDISMLEPAGLAIVMRSAKAELWPYADLFAEHHHEDGIARCLQQLFL